MKTVVYALLVIGLFTRCGEETSPSVIKGKLNEDFTLRPDQAILLTGATDGDKVDTATAITVKIIEAIDGRCPKASECVTAGSAKVTLKVSKGQTYSDTLYLCLGDCDYYLPSSPFKGGATHTFLLGADQYVATLKQVESIERGGAPKIVQRVTLLVAAK